MLKKLRSKKTAKKIWVVLAIFILPAFILWGSQSLIQSMSASNYAGRAFGKKITLQEFREALLATRSQLIMQMGEGFIEQENQIDLKPLVWDRIILLHEAKRRKIKVDDKRVTEFIQSYPLFLRDEGFDYPTYKHIVESVFRMPPRLLEEKIREDLMLSELFEQITSGVNFTPEQVKEIYKKEYEKISVAFLSASAKNFEDKVNLTDDQIKDYFMANQDRFRTPPSFNLEYLNIESPSKDKSYNLQKEEGRIKQIYLRLRREPDFAKIAKQFSLEMKETGFFSLSEPIPGIGWSAQLIGIIEELRPGQISPPIQTQKGWYILKLKQKKGPYIPPFEEIKTAVRDKLIQSKANQLARKTLGTALSKLRQAQEVDPLRTDLKTIAEEFGINSGVTDLFSRSSYISGIGSSDSFFAAVSGLKQGEVSEIVEMEQGLFVIKLKQSIPIDEERYEKEKEDFARKLIFKEKQARFTEFLLELRRKADLKISIG